MNITEIKQKIENGAFDKDFSMLYGDVSAARARYTAACDSFCDIFSERDNIRLFFRAPAAAEVGRQPHRSSARLRACRRRCPRRYSRGCSQ